MLVLDLRWLIFVILIALVVALLAGFRLGNCRRRTESPAAVEMADLNSILEHAPFGVLILQGTRVYSYANRYACQILGLESSRGGPLPETSWSHFLNIDRRAVRRDESATGRFRNLSFASSDSGEVTRTVQWWVHAIGDIDVVFLLDVTSRQRAEEASRSFINDLSHELRTPLATILTHLEVLSLPNLAPDTTRQSLRLLKEEARRMSRLANQLLELGRLETAVEIERRPIDILSLTEDAVSQITPLANERKIDVSIEADASLPLLTGDRDRIRQVLLNLLDNAVKYSREGDQVTLSLKRENEGTRCTIRDNGPGIPAKHLLYLTRRFYRAAPEEVEGSGLGLCLVEEILQRHGSSLKIESQTEGESTGTRVEFLLPATDMVTNASGES